MSSVAASHARTSALSELAAASTAPGAGYGANTPDWCANYDPALSLWKTAQTCFVEGSETFSETWPTAGMMRSGRSFRLAEWVPHTHETACFSWHTPTANDMKPAGQKEMDMVLRHMRGESVPNTYIRLRSQLAARSGQRLPANPTWLEWLMGFPIGWTETTPSETP
jgi:hypothetical protein